MGWANNILINSGNPVTTLGGRGGGITLSGGSSGGGTILSLPTILGINDAMASATNYVQWTSAANLTGNAAAPDARAFEDSVPNLLRYAMNLGTSGQGQFLPQSQVETVNGELFLVLQYRQRSAMTDVVLVPQFSTDLKNWTDLPASDITRGINADTRTAIYIATVPITLGQYNQLRVIARPNSGPVTAWPVSAGGNGHFYQGVVFPGRINWDDAETYAESRGGYLATITSDAENNFVFGLINHPQFWIYDGNTSGPWIGGFQPDGSTEPGSGWTWVHNEGPVVFSDWTSRQPDNTNGNEDRMQYWNWNAPSVIAPQWNDSPHAWGAPSIVVEWDSDPGSN